MQIKAASLSLAFQELAMQTKKQSEIMQKVDPKNAEQVERIGMGILANKSGHRYQLLIVCPHKPNT